MPVEQLEHHAVTDLQLRRREASDQDLGELLRVQIFQVRAQLETQLVAEASIRDGQADRLGPGRLVLQAVLQQLGQVEDLDALIAQLPGRACRVPAGPC